MITDIERQELDYYAIQREIMEIHRQLNTLKNESATLIENYYNTKRELERNKAQMNYLKSEYNMLQSILKAQK